VHILIGNLHIYSHKFMFHVRVLLLSQWLSW